MITTAFLLNAIRKKIGKQLIGICKTHIACINNIFFFNVITMETSIVREHEIGSKT